MPRPAAAGIGLCRGHTLANRVDVGAHSGHFSVFGQAAQPAVGTSCRANRKRWGQFRSAAVEDLDPEQLGMKIRGMNRSKLPLTTDEGSNMLQSDGATSMAPNDHMGPGLKSPAVFRPPFRPGGGVLAGALEAVGTTQHRASARCPTGRRRVTTAAGRAPVQRERSVVKPPAGEPGVATHCLRSLPRNTVRGSSRV